MLFYRAVWLHIETPKDKPKHATQLHTKTLAQKASYRVELHSSCHVLDVLEGEEGIGEAASGKA